MTSPMMGRPRSLTSPKQRGDACHAVTFCSTPASRSTLPPPTGSSTIAQAIGVSFTLARQAAAEVGHVRDIVDGETQPDPDRP